MFVETPDRELAGTNYCKVTQRSYIHALVPSCLRKFSVISRVQKEYSPKTCHTEKKKTKREVKRML